MATLVIAKTSKGVLMLNIETISNIFIPNLVGFKRTSTIVHFINAPSLHLEPDDWDEVWDKLKSCPQFHIHNLDRSHGFGQAQYGTQPKRD